MPNRLDGSESPVYLRMPRQPPTVAILLATHNGSRFIEAQLWSLQANDTSFEVHWLDDQSTDNTRELVHAYAKRTGITLVEWHKDEKQGVPRAYFSLLDRVDADIYLFCDQDDIWQPKKIDVTVAALTGSLQSAAFCFSDCLVFFDDVPNVLRPRSQVSGISSARALQETRIFMLCPAAGQTIGFTKPLRELYLSHSAIARDHAMMHSWWLYIIAVACGSSQMLTGVPTTLYRQHGGNVCADYFKRRKFGVESVISTWKLQPQIRRKMAKQAAGFILASATLASDERLDRLISIAKLVADLNRRQSLRGILRLAFRRTMWPNWRSVFWFSVNCLVSNADD
jgi:glycosyltransferase involved in cell wall biosynthesis